MDSGFNQQDLVEAFKQLNDLSVEEYGEDLGTATSGQDGTAEYRLARLTGILLKQNFGYAEEVDNSNAGASRAWEWFRGDELEEVLNDKSNAPNVELLKSTVEHWMQTQGMEQADASGRQMWTDLAVQLDSESELFKVIALWVKDKWDGSTDRTWKDRLNAEQTPEFSLALDAVDFATLSGLALALAPVLPQASVAIGVGAFILKFGYRKFQQRA